MRCLMPSAPLRRLARWAATRRGTLTCLLAAWAVLVLGQVTPSFDMNHDSAVYLTLGRSLAEGRGYTVEGRVCRLFPPLFPLMLSTVSDPARHDFRPEKLIVALTGLGAVLASYWLLAGRYDGLSLAVLSLLVAVLPPFVRYCGRVRSDVPFLFFASVFLAATDRYWRRERTSWPLALVAAAALAAAAMTRTAGLAFYVASAVWLARPSLWRRGRWKRAALCAVLLAAACLPLLGWSGYLARSESTAPSYLRAFRLAPPGAPASAFVDGVKRLALKEMRTVPVQVGNAARTVVDVGGGSLSPLWAVLVLPVMLLGLARRLRRAGPLEYAFCAYAVMVVFWPMPQGTRLWMPALPLMLGYLADGMAGFGRLAEEFPRLGRRRWIGALDGWLGPRRGTLVCWAAATLLALGSVAGVGRVFRSWSRYDEAVGGVGLTSAPLEVARFVNAERGQPATVAFEGALEVSFAVTSATSRVIGLPAAATGSELLSQIERVGATHLAIRRKLKDPTGRHRARAEATKLLLADPARFPLVMETEHVRIWRLTPPRPG